MPLKAARDHHVFNAVQKISNLLCYVIEKRAQTSWVRNKTHTHKTRRQISFKIFMIASYFWLSFYIFVSSLSWHTNCEWYTKFDLSFIFCECKNSFEKMCQTRIQLIAINYLFFKRKFATIFFPKMRHNWWFYI